MARLTYSKRALLDLERLSDFLLATDPAAALATFALIEEAILVTERHPYIGRPLGGGLRELLISRGRSGYVALYALDETADVIFILAIRHSREAGY